jgi:hypothetical protein
MYFLGLLGTYRQIFWGDSSYIDNIFRLKKINRIIMGARTRDTGRELFKILTILPLTSQYTFSLALSVVNNSSQLCNIKTVNNSTLFQASSHFTFYQKGPLYFGIKVSNKLPSQIKYLSSNVKQINNFLQLHSFYAVVEYFNKNDNWV